MLRTLKVYITCLLWVCKYSFVLAIGSESVFFENYNEEQGLVHNYVLCMFQDSHGILWVGTYGGVQTFNGYNFNKFNISGKKTNLLTNHVVNVIYEDKDNNIWFGTESGLNKYSLRTGQIWQYLNNRKDSNSLSHNNIRTIYQDNEGIFWIGTYGGGLNRFDEKHNKFVHYKAVPGDLKHLQSDLINTFFVDKNGLYWIGTENGGISVFDKDKGKVVQNFQKGPGRLSNVTVSCIYQDDNDNYWIGTWDGGMDKYNPNTNSFSYFIHNPSDPNGIRGNNVRSIVQTDKDFLWISTFGEGLYKFDLKKEIFTKILINSSKEGNSSQDLIWTLFRDTENNLWLGTFGKGVFKENSLKNTFPYYVIKQPGDLKLSISSIVQDKTGKLWVGTLNRGIYLYNLKDQTYSKFNSSLLHNESISKVYLDSKDRLWIGSDNALYTIMPDRKTIRRFSHDPKIKSSISESAVNAIFEDSEGNIWIGFWGTGIDVIKKEELNKTNDAAVEFSKYMSGPDETASFLHYRIWNFFEDSKRTVWIGTSGELNYYNLEEKIFKSLPIMVASSFYEDQHGYLWIGSIGNGLYKLDKNKQIVRKYTLTDGLPTLDILAIQKDKKGRFWLGTSSGLSLLDPRSDNISNFDKNYGLQNFSINHNAFTILASGQMVFGGNNGFNVFTAEDISQDFIPSPIIITDIKLNNKSIIYENVLDSSFSIRSSVSILDTLKLDYKNKVLTLDFATVNYSIPSSITYAYKLDGFDEDWVVTDANNRTATYTNLNEGEYVFKVKMSYSNGKWMENSRKLRIIISPPFWKQWWFRILIALMFIGIVWFLLWNKLGKNKLAMMVHQKLIITEKLMTEQELLAFQNEQLTDTLNQYHKKIASFSLNYQEVKDYLKTVYQNLKDLKSAVNSSNVNKVNQIIQSLDEKILEMDEMPDFEENINILFDDFVKRFAEAFPKSTPTDIKICSLIRMNKSNKEIAKQLSITLGSLETSRHRIRKKLNLPTDVNLNDFILRF
jgi:ligand-binding sensor domain-containing protein